MFDTVSQIHDNTGSILVQESKLDNAYLTQSKYDTRKQEVSQSLGLSENVSDMQLIRSVCMEIIKLERDIEVERDFLADKSDVQLDQVFLMLAFSLADKLTAT